MPYMNSNPLPGRQGGRMIMVLSQQSTVLKPNIKEVISINDNAILLVNDNAITTVSLVE